MLGISAGKHYPTDRFWCIPHDIGNKVILGLDAHTVDLSLIHILTEEKQVVSVEIDTEKYHKYGNNPLPVSYTHLDVYKRQSGWCLPAEA